MTSNNKLPLKDNAANANPASDCCDELLIEYIDSFGSNLANLRQDLREIVREELYNLLRELRKPKPYIERGYRS